MERPIKYMQTDPAWKNVPYAVAGEHSTIGTAGCGPTCAAMALATILRKDITPVDTCKWALEHGYKAKNQGTFYSYFEAQFAACGVKCSRMNGRSLYGMANAPEHDRMLSELGKGNLVIACMGRGMWTNSGHFVLVYGKERGEKLLINDPASVAYEREHGAPSQFFRQVKYYFVIDCAGDIAKKEPKMEVTKKNAKDIVKSKANLSDSTIAFLDAYKYADDLFLKLAKAMK